MKEVAVIGGTFNPVTLAHEAIMEACLELPDIDEVWVMPSGQRYDKPDLLDDNLRIEMLELTKIERFESDPRLVISDFEQHLPKPTQTYRTVEALGHAYPDNLFWFVFGADSYQDMPDWERGESLQKSLGMLVVPRAGYEMPAESGNIRHLHAKDMGAISSTQVRDNYRHGYKEKFIGSAVANYIKAHNLYQF